MLETPAQNEGQKVSSSSGHAQVPVVQEELLINEGYHQIFEANRYLRQNYNTYVSFAQNALPKGPAQQAAIAVQERLQKMREILDGTKRQLLEHRGKLYDEVDAFRHASSAGPLWFLEGNILSLSREEMIECFQPTKPLVSADALITCLRRSFPEERQRLQRLQQRKARLSNEESEADRIDRFLWLTDTLYHELLHGHRQAFEAAIMYVTDVLRYYAHSTFPYEEVQSSLERKLGTCYDRTPEAHEPISCRQPYLDLATPYRRLREAYLWRSSNDREGSGTCLYPGVEGTGGMCFHTATAPMLHLLLRCARNEIRRKAMYVAGSILPLELAEVVVQFALVAEGLPMNPEAYVAKDILESPGADDPCEMMIDIAITRTLRRRGRGSEMARALEASEPNGVL